MAYICRECGGDNLLMESYSRWDREKDAFVHNQLKDGGDNYCFDCGDKCQSMWISDDAFDILHGGGLDGLEQLLDYLVHFEEKVEGETGIVFCFPDYFFKLVLNAARELGKKLQVDIEDKIRVVLTVADL